MAPTIISTPAIYAIVNRITGKSYVGSAISPRRRWPEHRKALRGGRHHSVKLQRSWNIHGEAAFDFVVLESVLLLEDLVEREQSWIEARNSYRSGYNAAPMAGSQLGFKHSEETRAKLRAAQAKRKAEGRCYTPPPPSDETRKRQSIAAKARKGRVVTEETRRKISESLKTGGNHRGNTGRKFTPEHIAKIMAAKAATLARKKAGA